MADKQAVDIESVYAVLEIPERCVELKLVCKIFVDGKLQTVQRTMDMQEISHAVQEAEFYIPEDAVFTITDKGREYLEQLERERNGG